jgi:murein DD-endopeptidase MepM/ murein hydrolase activator NlpD
MSISNRFGIRSIAQVRSDLGEVVRDGLKGRRFQFDVRSAGLLRPRLSLPAYLGVMPEDGLAPVFNLFDRVGGGRRFTQRVSRSTLRDFRGGRLSYDEHDGTDLVCPIGTPIAAAAPGVVVMVRDRWLRGGLTVAVDHGHGVITQYTHCSRAVREPGEVVRRGDVVALSGAAGYDMVQFFPWIPPHVHFMVYVDGMPVDPFLSDGEATRSISSLIFGSVQDEATRSSSPRSTSLTEGSAASFGSGSDGCGAFPCIHTPARVASPSLRNGSTGMPST